MLYIGILIFIVVFYCIITEKVPSSWATMAGGLLMTLIGIINQEQVLETIYNRLEVLFLLVGMMMIVLLVSETGVFQWFAIKVAQLVRGEPFKLIILLACVTALCSAFLDNVTTILLMAPVSILLAKQLKLNPFPFVITEVMSANIGGLATLIGDPTQLIIGAEGKLTLNNFVDKGLAIIALSGAVFLALIAKKSPKEMFEGVEWETLFFFIGLFMMIKGIENLDIIKFIGDKMISLTEGHFGGAVFSTMWISAAFTSVIGNVANAATFSKILNIMTPSFAGEASVKALWWALSFGSCLGGNLSLLGSATNVVAVGAADKAGCKINFVQFLKFGGIIAIENLIIASIYIYFRYL